MNNRFAAGVRRRAPWVVALLCSSAQARAQAPEPPPVAAPPAASAPEAPPITPPPAAQEAPPITPPPVIPAPASSAPIAPPAPPVVAVKPPLAWAGTTFAWDNQISAKLLGIGPNYYGADDGSFVTAFSLTPSYFVFWRPRHQISVSGRVTVVAELTSSGTTRVSRSANFADIPLGLDYAATLFSHGHGQSIGGVRTMKDPTLLGEGDFRTWGLVSTYLVLPASPESRAAGVDLATSVGVGIRQQIRLLGGDSRWLSYLLITASERWTHAFTSAPSSSNGFPAEDPFGAGSVNSVIANTFSHTLAFTLPIYRDLQLDSTFMLRTGILSRTPPLIVCVPTGGCEPVGQLPESLSTVRGSTLFSLGLSYQIIPEVGIALGYVNDAPQLGQDGLKRSMFYSNYAQLYSSVTLSFDRLYQRLFPPAPASAGAPR